MKLYNSIACALAIAATALMTASCTSEFDKWNTDSNSASEEDMTHDNMNTGAFFSQMEHNVYTVGLDKGGSFQVIDMLTGGLFSGYFSNIKASYDVGSTHSAHYSLPDKWMNIPFNDTYTNLMQPWLSLTTNSEKAGTTAVTALANVVKVFGMARITDMYGPIPYTQFGTGINVAYDSQEAVYNAFFTELDNAIEELETYHTASPSSKLLANYDFVFAGDVEKWIRFANTLRLRLALRVAYANESLAKQEAQKSFDDAVGFLEESAKHVNGAKFSFLNPFWEVTKSWGDMRHGRLHREPAHRLRRPSRQSLFRRGYCRRRHTWRLSWPEHQQPELLHRCHLGNERGELGRHAVDGRRRELLPPR